MTAIGKNLRLLLSIGTLAICSLAKCEISQWADTFSELSPEWRQVTTGDGTIKAHNHAVTFHGATASKAQIERDAVGDLITVRARISQWAAIYLIWSPENWCGVGQISPTPFGRLYSTASVGNHVNEVDHRGIDFGLARWVRIQLGDNYIRFAYSSDGNKWRTLRTIERPKKFAGAPQIVAAGKYYADAKTADNQVVEGSIYNFDEEPTPSDIIHLNDTELELVRHPRPEAVEALLEESDDDPTYEQVAKYYPPMQSPREIVGIPAHPLDIGVDWLGRIDVSPWGPPLAWLEVGDPLKPLGESAAQFTRRLQDGYLPIDTLTCGRDGIEYKLTVLGWSEDHSVDRSLIAYVRLTAKATNDEATVPTQFALSAPNKSPHIWHVTADQKEATFCLRFEFPKLETAEQIDPAEFLAKAEDIAAFWSTRLVPATRFEVPDQRVMKAYRAWIVYSMLNADTINGFIEPHDGAGFYEEMFGNSVSMHTIAMDLYGLNDYAAQILDTQRHFQQTNGLYTQVCGLTDPGGFLVGLAHHYWITGDKEWLRRVEPNIVAQAKWIIEQRRKAPTGGVVRGLIKFRPYNDYVAEVYNYLGNTWCAQGLEDCGAVLKEIDSPDAETISKEGQLYGSDILRSMSKAAFKYQGQTLLPLEPETHRMLKLEKYRAGGYYGLSASPLLGIGLLNPWDKQTTWLVDALEKRGGLIAGLCEFEGGIDHAYTYGYLYNELRRGETRKTLLGFWSMLAFGMTRETYSPVEVTMIQTGENHFTLPHLYSCTEQLRLLRALLLREDGNTLWLGDAIPRAWLAPGEVVRVKKAPTEFGEVSYEITPTTEGTIKVHIDPPVRRIPAEIRLRLRHPQQLAIRSVSTEPNVKVKTDQDVIILRNLKEPVSLTVRY